MAFWLPAWAEQDGRRPGTQVPDLAVPLRGADVCRQGTYAGPRVVLLVKGFRWDSVGVHEGPQGPPSVLGLGVWPGPRALRETKRCA